MVKEIFIDLDGVIFDFEKRFYELFREHSLTNYPNSNSARKKRYKEEFEEFVKGRNFANLDLMPDFRLAIPFLNKISKTANVYILSSTANEEYLKEISAQKKECLKKYDINFYPIFVPGKRLKQLYSRPGRVLIDDTKQNIDDWNAMGGIGIQHINWTNTIKRFNAIN